MFEAAYASRRPRADGFAKHETDPNETTARDRAY
jgi:hypothetical protein